jgi:hypothetical protein
MWALRHLRNRSNAVSGLLNIFNAPETPPLKKVIGKVLTKTVKVFYFGQKGFALDSFCFPFKESQQYHCLS